MDCGACPALDVCARTKRDYIRGIDPKYREDFAHIVYAYCPMEDLVKQFITQEVIKLRV